MNGRNELLIAAMQVILHAGNARSAADEALEGTKRFNFQEAASHLQKVKGMITLAHGPQTNIIQKGAGRHGYEPSLLLAHAQDILTTIKSELYSSRQLIDVLKIIKNNKQRSLQKAHELHYMQRGAERTPLFLK